MGFRRYLLFFSLVAGSLILSGDAFRPTPGLFAASKRSHLSFSASHEGVVEDDRAIQWELFEKHHAKGSWKGIWSSYNYMGDLEDETVASVDLKKTGNQIEQTHQIVVGAKRSDCATCFDSMETKEIPVATYTPNNLRKARLGACGMVNGPSLLRNGAMATELVLSHGDGRVRVILQHAPVWERGIEPGSCPPQGLKLFRCMVSREALRSTAPTAETEAQSPPSKGNPIFYRPVPPFNWHKKWSGTSWTWGPEAGNRGWSIEELEEMDAWHGGQPPECWNLRLPGGVFVQAPRIVTDAEVGVCRLAWLPDDDFLLRIEAGVLALQPMYIEDDSLAGFEPPSLSSLRCDVLQKTGDLEGQPQFMLDEKDVSASTGTPAPAAVSTESRRKQEQADEKGPKPPATGSTESRKNDDDDDETPDSGLKAIRDAIQL